MRAFVMVILIVTLLVLGGYFAKRAYRPRTHRFFEIHNYETPTGWWVCANLDCDYSLAQPNGIWVWETDLEEASKTKCPHRI